MVKYLKNIRGTAVKYNNLTDMHTHCILSFDGNDTCDELCSSAIDKGIKTLAITDHCDIDGNDFDALKYCSEQFEETLNTKNKYKSNLEVLQGIEIGQGIYRKTLTEKVINTFDYDFILGSLHNLENMEDFYFLDYKKYDVYNLLERYFSDLLELCKWGAFDSLAHLTYPLRYIVAREKINVDMSKFDELIEAIFESLVKNDKALEINTSGLFMDINDTLPNIEYVKRFKKIGGKYITIGSDSHYADRIGQGIEKGYEIAVKSGFNSVTKFVKREPILINIE